MTLDEQIAVAAHLPEPASEEEQPGIGHQVAAVLAVFVGLSVANAFGGLLQLAYFCVCLVIAVRVRHEMPRRELILATCCGLVAVVATLQHEASFAPIISFVRPVVEGYLLAVVLHALRIRTFRPLILTLAAYLGLQFIASAIMLVLPALRLGLLDSWYAGDGYQNDAFLGALVFRGFGISRHHLYGLPLAAGTLSAVLVVASGLRTKGRPPLMLAALGGIVIVLLNARIGVVPILLCYVLGIATIHRAFYLKQILVVLPLAGAALFLLAQRYLGDSMDLVSAWLLEGVRQFSDPTAASASTTVTDLQQMVVLPSTWSAWLIGDGRVCEPGDACYSDIGWVRLLQAGGVVLTAGVSLLYTRMIAGTFVGQLWGGTDESGLDGASRRLLAWLFFLTFVAATIKGDSYGANEYSRLLMALGFLSQLVDAPAPVSVAAALSPAALPEGA
jgi:hypothetical protein